PRLHLSSIRTDDVRESDQGLADGGRGHLAARGIDEQSLALAEFRDRHAAHDIRFVRLAVRPAIPLLECQGGRARGRSGRCPHDRVLTAITAVGSGQSHDIARLVEVIRSALERRGESVRKGRNRPVLLRDEGPARRVRVKDSYPDDLAEIVDSEGVARSVRSQKGGPRAIFPKVGATRPLVRATSPGGDLAGVIDVVGYGLLDTKAARGVREVPEQPILPQPCALVAGVKFNAVAPADDLAFVVEARDLHSAGAVGVRVRPAVPEVRRDTILPEEHVSLPLIG